MKGVMIIPSLDVMIIGAVLFLQKRCCRWTGSSYRNLCNI